MLSRCCGPHTHWQGAGGEPLLSQSFLGGCLPASTRCAGTRDGRLAAGAGGRERPARRARRPGFFEVKKITPPAESLGIHELPSNTHNGDQISVQGEDFVVRTLILKYKLVGGRYQRDHSRLDCTSTSRFIVDTYYEQLLTRKVG